MSTVQVQSTSAMHYVKSAECMQYMTSQMTCTCTYAARRGYAPMTCTYRAELELVFHRPSASGPSQDGCQEYYSVEPPAPRKFIVARTMLIYYAFRITSFPAPGKNRLLFLCSLTLPYLENHTIFLYGPFFERKCWGRL